MSSPSPPSSPSAGTSPQASVEPASTETCVTTPICTAFVGDEATEEQNALGEEDMEYTSMSTFNAPCVGDGDNEASFWDIIAESHMRLENYSEQSIDQEMSEPTSGLMSPIRSTTTPVTFTPLMPSPLPSTNLPMGYEDLLGGTALPLSPSPLLMQHQPIFPGVTRPSHYITFDLRLDGTPFPLSKPIIREDGLLLVGTEIVGDPSLRTDENNRIFVTNFLSSGTPAHIAVKEEVRDIHWLGSCAAVVAIGKEIHVIQLKDVGGSCRLQNPINRVHSDTIRELAVSPTMDTHVLSGGFDETVVLTDVRNLGDPQAAAVVGKFDAHDVVSSVRWSPLDTQMSWTTDGGDFQVVDIRVRSPQLQMPLYSFVNMNILGGLFAHEYLNTFTVVLGFERGHMAFVDLRMPRQNCCTSLIDSKLTGVGEIRRSKTNKLTVFGRGGFARANFNGAAGSLEQLTLHQQQPLSSYKTSGDFSYERGHYLAASDNLGIVAVYTEDTIFEASTEFNTNVAAW